MFIAIGVRMYGRSPRYAASCRFLCRQAGVLLSASFRLRLAMDILVVQLTVPLARRVEDFPPRECTCRAHQKERRTDSSAWLSAGPPLLVDGFRRTLGGNAPGLFQM